MSRDPCICDWPSSCGGAGYLHCHGCGGDLCVCACGGDMDCFGCPDCEDAEDYYYEDEQP